MPDREAAAEKVLAAIREAPVASKCVLLETLGTIGGVKALKAVSEDAGDGDSRIKDAATACSADGLVAHAAPEDLLELAKVGRRQVQDPRPVAATSASPWQLGLPADQRLAMCREAFALSQRDGREAARPGGAGPASFGRGAGHGPPAPRKPQP